MLKDELDSPTKSVLPATLDGKAASCLHEALLIQADQ